MGRRPLRCYPNDTVLASLEDRQHQALGGCVCGCSCDPHLPLSQRRSCADPAKHSVSPPLCVSSQVEFEPRHSQRGVMDFDTVLHAACLEAETTADVQVGAPSCCNARGSKWACLLLLGCWLSLSLRLFGSELSDEKGLRADLSWAHIDRRSLLAAPPDRERGAHAEGLLCGSRAPVPPSHEA